MRTVAPRLFIFYFMQTVFFGPGHAQPGYKYITPQLMCDGGGFLFSACQVMKPIPWLTVDLADCESNIFPYINIQSHRVEYKERIVYFRAYSIIVCLPPVRTHQKPFLVNIIIFTETIFPEKTVTTRMTLTAKYC